MELIGQNDAVFVAGMNPGTLCVGGCCVSLLTAHDFWRKK